MSSDDIPFKVYLRHDSTIKEVRKLYMGKYGKSLASLREKIKILFPELQDKDFTISWIDKEGDEIVIASEEEYICGKDEHVNAPRGQESTMKLYVTILSQNKKSRATKKGVGSEEKVKHAGVICDGCNCDITGFRYKCIQCADFDLCSECEAAGKHADHYMIRMSQPLQFHDRRFYHHIGKALRRSGVSSQKRSCPREDYLPNKVHCTLKPWIEDYLPFLDDFVGTLLEGMKPDTDTGNNPSQAPQTEEKAKSEEKASYTDENATKFPGAGRKLIDKENKKDEESGSDTASVASQIDEWTVINNTAEVNQASSNSAKVNETETKQVPSTSMAPSAPEESSIKKVYPELPEAKTVHHQDPLINEAIEAMMRMGFSNEGGLLTCLLEHQKGNINSVIEILSPTNKK